MVNLFRGTLLSIALFALTAASARAELSINFAPVVAGVLPKNATFTYQGIPLTATAKLGYGFGGLVGLRFSPFWGIEGGMVYVQRNYTETGTVLGIPLSIDVNTKAMHIPAGVRIYLGSLISVEAGAFFESSVGTQNGSANYGVQGGARFSLPLSHTLALFAEARYNQGLKDLGGFKGTDLVFALVGISLGGPKK